MAIARVVSFEGVSTERMEQMQREMSDGDRMEGMPSGELIVLHEPGSEKSLVVFLLETEDDYQRAHAILDAMPAADTPGTRTSVEKYNVAHRSKD